MLKTRLNDEKGGVLEVKPNKTEKSSGKKLCILLDHPDHGCAQHGQLLDRIRNRECNVASPFIVSTSGGASLNEWTLRARLDDANPTR